MFIKYVSQRLFIIHINMTHMIDMELTEKNKNFFCINFVKLHNIYSNTLMY